MIDFLPDFKKIQMPQIAVQWSRTLIRLDILSDAEYNSECLCANKRQGKVRKSEPEGLICHAEMYYLDNVYTNPKRSVCFIRCMHLQLIESGMQFSHVKAGF
jgi:hypothetical protein